MPQVQDGKAPVTTPDKGKVILPELTAKDKAAAEFDEKGKDVAADKKGKAEDPRVKLVMDKQLPLELALIARNPDMSVGLGKRLDASQACYRRHGIGLQNGLGDAIASFQAELQKPKLGEDEFKALKKSVDESVGYVDKLRDPDKTKRPADPKEADLKAAYLKLIPEEKKK